MACQCDLCGASSADVNVDTYNDGDLICDRCIFDEARVQAACPCATFPPRPEGYYHCSPGTFD